MEEERFLATTTGRALRFFLILLFILIIIVGIFDFFSSGKKASPPRRKPSPPSSSTTPSVAASATYSCPDYESIFGPNYNNQLFVNWQIWSNILTFSNTSDPTVINYQYNTASQNSFQLYSNTMNSYGCGPQIKPPVPKTPTNAPDFTFTPVAASSGVTCNVSLAYQYYVSFINQYYQNQQQEQTQVMNWLSNQQSGGPSVVTPAIQQGAIALQSQFFKIVTGLTNFYNTETESLGCQP